MVKYNTDRTIMKNTISYLLLLPIAMITSCEKNTQNEISEKLLTGANLRSQLVVNNVITSNNLAPEATRKAVQTTTTDMGTGQTTTTFDCSTAGTSCDVGEASPTPKINGTSDAGSRMDIFLSDMSIKSSIEKGNIQVEEGQDYFVLKDGYNGNILYAYKHDPHKNLSAYNAVSAANKVAKINTETNIVECLEDGSNCKVSTEEPPKETIGGLVPISGLPTLAQMDLYFPDKGLSTKIETGEYSLFKGSNYVMIKPKNSSAETFYVQN